MANRQPNMNDLMKSPQAAQLLKNRTAVENLAKAPETQHLMNLLNQIAGGGLKSAAEAAMKGDTSQLMGLMDRLMKDPNGAKVVEQLNKTIQGK